MLPKKMFEIQGLGNAISDCFRRTFQSINVKENAVVRCLFYPFAKFSLQQATTQTGGLQ